MTEYIVLRAPRPSRLTSPSVGGAPTILGGGFEATTPTALSNALSVETMGRAELRSAARDASVVDVARKIPTRLIAPKEMTDAPAASTWGVSAVGADTSSATGANVRVAVLDTGIDRDHPAFAGVNIVEKDFTGSGNGDIQGHGTHCAGTVFGRDVDGNRIGVAQGVTDALIGKVLGNDGSGGSDMLFQGMTWAAEQDAQVISMSLGFDFPGLVAGLIAQGFPEKLAGSVAIEGYRANLRVFDAIMEMIDARSFLTGGTVVVAAAGNESERQLHPDFEVSVSIPAAAKGVVSVGAVGEAAGGLTVADFSNTNPVLCGPGVSVLSAKSGGGLVAFNGTSMATPHVAGLAALWWETIRTMGIPATANGVKARLQASCVTDVFAPGVDILDRGDGLAKAPA